VRRVVTKNRQATGVQYVDASGEEVFQPADVVFLGAFTLNNVKLLLLSGIGTPYDPVTLKGTLGRNLTHQVFGVATQVFFDKPLNLFMGAGSLGVMISDFDGDHGFDGSEPIVRGGTVSMSISGNRPIASFGTMPAGAARNWGSEWKAASLVWRDKVGSIGYAGEHMAYRTNFMDLDPTYTDKMGDPLIRFTLDWTEHEYQQRVHAAQIQAKIAKAMGFAYQEARPTRAKYNVIQYQTTHVQGGTIMGTSPEKSVVDTNLRHWDVKNLYVMGASTFPQNASGNPTLTALATLYKAADAFVAGHGGKHDQKEKP
jgi:gluconate 2-dehydrogenase alpha chain